MESLAHMEIDHNSRIPKYKQVIDSIVKGIANGSFKIGEKIPSINEISEEYYLSRDTVEKAYSQLKKSNVIVSVKGKGYYVSKTDLDSKVRILFLVNKLSSYKMRIYNAFRRKVASKAKIDLKIYHCEEQIFLNILEENIGNYDHYVVMSHFINSHQEHVGHTDEVLAALRKVPSKKLILVDNRLNEIENCVSQIYQDFEKDIFGALNQAINKLKKYDKLILVYPERSVYPYPKEILSGFKRFCLANAFEFEVLDQIYEGMEFQSRDAYITIEEMDLVNLLKQVRDHHLEIGKDIGIISYNDTPLKELLDITVISTDFNAMGEKIGNILLDGKGEKLIKNRFSFIDRKSI
ncbi:GntR family transcriptional regulator [Sungkyunkwania multivorans]|uniref:GntR family transcriptional regulator n=1 Tax=Sungkyunkwania multivorans TaxID=1173618 RepID=A0ABW3CV86_9FLAO